VARASGRQGDVPVALFHRAAPSAGARHCPTGNRAPNASAGSPKAGSAVNAPVIAHAPASVATTPAPKLVTRGLIRLAALRKPSHSIGAKQTQFRPTILESTAWHPQPASGAAAHAIEIPPAPPCMAVTQKPATRSLNSCPLKAVFPFSRNPFFAKPFLAPFAPLREILLAKLGHNAGVNRT
jgi:hypothetical protein